MCGLHWCSLTPLLIFSCLGSPSMKFQGVQQIMVHISPWSLSNIREYYPSYNQNTKDTPRDVKMSNPLISLSCTLCCLSWCHNPSFRLATKAWACKGAGQEGSSGITSHAPGSVRECEGINPHTPKWVSTLAVRVPVDF